MKIAVMFATFMCAHAYVSSPALGARGIARSKLGASKFAAPTMSLEMAPIDQISTTIAGVVAVDGGTIGTCLALRSCCDLVFRNRFTEICARILRYRLLMRYRLLPSTPRPGISCSLGGALFTTIINWHVSTQEDIAYRKIQHFALLNSNPNTEIKMLSCDH